MDWTRKLTIRDVDIDGKRVFIRVDFNVPLDEFNNIADDTRIRAALPTIEYALDHNAKVILASHMGRPKGERNEKYSMRHLVQRVKRLAKRDVKFADDCVGPVAEKAVASLAQGELLLLENLRFHKEEEKNDPAFSQKLAALADVYVNDAFGSAHRAHASTHGITKYVQPAVAGFLMKKEIDYFHQAVANPIRPVVAMIGGAKVSSKIGVLNNLVEKVDKLIIGGGMAFTFLKALGYEIGKNILEADQIPSVIETMEKAKKRGVKLYLPVDFVAAERIDVRAQTKIVTSQELPEDWVAPDIGPATVRLFSEALENAKTIIWNGPMGVFEMDSFARGTMSLVDRVADSYALTILGGGDTDVAVHKAGVADRISFISTGGGAFLELLEGKELPGMAALTDK